MKDSAKAHYNQNRELILASKQALYQANPKAKRVFLRINSRRKINPTRLVEFAMYTVWVQCVEALFTHKGPVHRLRATCIDSTTRRKRVD